MKIEHFSNIKDGKLQRNVRDLLNAELSMFEGKRVRILIEKISSTRSAQQNRYYWGVVIPFQIECFKERWGEMYSKDQVHDWNKGNIFCTEKIDEETGEIFKMPGSSVVKGKLLFDERMENIRQFFHNKFEWKIPLPNEQLEFHGD